MPIVIRELEIIIWNALFFGFAKRKELAEWLRKKADEIEGE